MAESVSNLAVPEGEWPEALLRVFADQVYQDMSLEDRELCRLATLRMVTVVPSEGKTPFLRCFFHSVATTSQGEFLLSWHHMSGVVVQNVYAGLPSIIEAYELTFLPWLRAAFQYGIDWKDEASPVYHAAVLTLRPWDGGSYPTAFGRNPENRGHWEKDC